MNIKLKQHQHNLLTAELEELITDLGKSKDADVQLLCCVLAELHKKMYTKLYDVKPLYKTGLTPAQAVALNTACSRYLMDGIHPEHTQMLAGAMMLKIHPKLV
ncbi:MAG: hypothetical protein Q8L89_04290 [Gammaproteobacteria bacterium]|nr:hypothetical protein [Gammaproteobacteria bacterium]